MRTWHCLNCDMEFDRPQPQNRCICGMHLQVLLFCDKPSCPRDLTGQRFIPTVDGRIHCEQHLAEDLEISIALEAAQ